ncbi:MAG: hypothetical protein HQ568_07465 [Calditrichaeota bacterium]|nr:hypothetical protein [Calditrichota bacterium]
MKLIDIEEADTIYLEDHSASPGKYTPVSGSSMLIQGTHNYRIIAYTPAPHNETVWAETVVPDPFPPNSVKTCLMDTSGNKVPVTDGEELKRDKYKYLYFEWPLVDSAGGYFGSATTLVPLNNLAALDPDWGPRRLPWELVDSLDGDVLGINDIQAVAYIDKYFYIAGKLNGVNKVFKVDRGNNSIVHSFDQFGNSANGMQDLACDGELFWGAEDSVVYGFTPNGSLIDSINLSFGGVTAIAWEPDAKILWISNGSTIQGHLPYSNRIPFIRTNNDYNITSLSWWKNEPDRYSLYVLHISNENKPFILKMNQQTGDTLLVQDLSIFGEDWANKQVSSAFLTDDMDLEFRYFLTVSKADNRIYILRPGVQDEYFADAGRSGWVVMRENQNFASLPWVIFNFAGPHRINVNAIAPAFYDYLFSSMRVQQGMLQRPISNIHGGLGIFGGLAEYTIDIIMVPNE